jgi:hypothetical protein
MKIDKLFRQMEKLFFTPNDEKAKNELRLKLLDKMKETKEEIKLVSNEEEKEALKDKMKVLKKFLKQVKE